MEESDAAFTGVTLIPVPSESFEPSGKPRSTIGFAQRRLIGAVAAAAFRMLTTAISYLFGIANSLTARIFMDHLLTGINADRLYPFLSVMILLTAIRSSYAYREVLRISLSRKMSELVSEQRDTSITELAKCMKRPDFFRNQVFWWSE